MANPSTRRWHKERVSTGLIGSLGELSLRSSLVAICVPVVAVALAWAAGRPLEGSGPAHLEGPALAAMLATFVLVPMFALTGATTAIVVAGATLLSARRPTGAQLLRAAFVVAVGAWAVAMAVAYDVVVVPRVTA